MNKTGNAGMCGTKHWFVSDGKYCKDCGHLPDADCHMNPEKFESGSIACEMAHEVARAREIYPAFNSAHEGYAVLLEEMLELQAEVFKKQSNRSKASMRMESIQIGAMAIRMIQDCC